MFSYIRLICNRYADRLKERPNVAIKPMKYVPEEEVSRPEPVQAKPEPAQKAAPSGSQDKRKNDEYQDQRYDAGYKILL